MSDPATSYTIPTFAHEPVVIPGATDTAAGVLSAADHAKVAGSLLPGSIGLTAGVDATPGATIHIVQTVNFLHLTGNVTTSTIDVSAMPQVNGQDWSGIALFIVFNNHTWATDQAGNIASPALSIAGGGGPILVVGYYDHGQGKWYFA